jgi:hypothetical protein
MQVVPLIVRLEQQLQTIENQGIELLDASTIKRRYKDPNNMIVMVGYDY